MKYKYATNLLDIVLLILVIFRIKEFMGGGLFLLGFKLLYVLLSYFIYVDDNVRYVIES